MQAKAVIPQPHLLGHMPGGSFTVSGQHGHFQPLRFQPMQQRPAAFADLIRHQKPAPHISALIKNLGHPGGRSGNLPAPPGIR